MTDVVSDRTSNGDGWFRNQDNPQFVGTGPYTAWIVGTKNVPSPGSAGVSCAGWFVVRNDDGELPVRYARTSATSDSDEQRAGVAAALRCLETLPKNASIEIRTRFSWIADGLNGLMHKWQSANWIVKGETKKHNGWEIWERIIYLSESRGLDVVAKFEGADDKFFRRLRTWALCLATETSDELGIEPGDRYAFRKGQAITPRDGSE
jgi:ribonuclease HI